MYILRWNGYVKSYSMPGRKVSGRGSTPAGSLQPGQERVALFIDVKYASNKLAKNVATLNFIRTLARQAMPTWRITSTYPVEYDRRRSSAKETRLSVNPEKT